MLPSIVSPQELLGRYLLEEGYFSRAKNTVKPRAFMPPPDLHLSVFRIDGLQLKEIWAIGQRKVIDAMLQPKELFGIASIVASKVKETNLEIESDNIPLRHANIVGWPEEKEKQKIIAQELAAEANLVLK